MLEATEATDSTRQKIGSLEKELSKLKGSERSRIWDKVIDQGFGFLNNLLKWGSLVLITYFVYLSIGQIRGLNTAAFFGLKISVSTGDSNWIDSLINAVTPAVGVLGTYYGIRQKKLRNDIIEQNSAYIKALELRWDKNRSSSSLTKRGKSNESDL